MGMAMASLGFVETNSSPNTSRIFIFPVLKHLMQIASIIPSMKYTENFKGFMDEFKAALQGISGSTK